MQPCIDGDIWSKLFSGGSPEAVDSIKVKQDADDKREVVYKSSSQLQVTRLQIMAEQYASVLATVQQHAVTVYNGRYGSR